MNILITGAGLIGCYSAVELAEGGDRVILFDVHPDYDYIRHVFAKEAPIIEAGDLRDLPTLLTIMRKHEIEVVVHTAGLIGKRVAEHPYTGIWTNVLGTVHVAEAVRLSKVRRMVFLSSFGAYNWDYPTSGPITENHPLSGQGLYGATKAANEHILMALADLYSFELVILRPAGVYGFGHFRGGSSVGRLMHELVTAAAAGTPWQVTEERIGINEYVYVKDVAMAVKSACHQEKLTHRTFNIGVGVLSGAREVVHCLCEILPGARIELIPAKGEEGKKGRPHPLDIGRAKRELSYEPRYDLKGGIKDYLSIMERGKK